MSFAYTSALQARIALAVWNVPNSSLTATQKVQLDGTWTSGSLTAGAAYDAYVEIAQLAQWFEQASSAPDTSYPQPAWDRLFVSLAASLLTKTVRPERYSEFKADYETALDQSLDTFTRDLVSSTSLAGQGVGLAGIRAFCIDHCVKRANANTGLRRRLFPSIAQIDGHIQGAINFVWNMKPWHFRSRQVVLNVVTVSVTAATWTESNKTLTQTGLFTNANIAAGARFLCTGGTSAIQTEYVVSSKTSSNAIVLETSLSDTSGDLTTGDITGVLQVAYLTGLNTGETMDAIKSRAFYFDGTYAGRKLLWTDMDGMAKSKARYGPTTSMPQYFRWEKYGSGITWHLSPFPDTNYTMRGAATVSGPGTLTTSASLDTAIAKFPTEFGTVIRDLTLARVLKSFNASDGDRMMNDALEQCERLLPVYADLGFGTRQMALTDAYEDNAAITRELRGY